MEQNLKKITQILGYDKLDTHPSLVFVQRDFKIPPSIVALGLTVLIIILLLLSCA
jgi:receptor expression-enhancing protein 5/6